MSALLLQEHSQTCACVSGQLCDVQWSAREVPMFFCFFTRNKKGKKIICILNDEKKIYNLRIISKSVIEVSSSALK